MNKGKNFEQNFRKSIPEDIFYYRLKDTASSYYGGNDNLRFSQTNMCDSIMFDGNYLYLLELKNHKGKSLPFSCIRENQIKELALNSLFKNIKSCIIINFEELEECYCLFIDDIEHFIRQGDRKSIPVDYCRENGLKIEMVKLITNYKYNINKFLKGIKER